MTTISQQLSDLSLQQQQLDEKLDLILTTQAEILQQIKQIKQKIEDKGKQKDPEAKKYKLVGKYYTD